MKRSTLFNLLGIALLLAALFGSGVQKAAAGGGGPVFVVTLVNEGNDAHPGDGVCAILAGPCTLRAAIQEANAEGGVHTINFNLPGSGVHVMSITSGHLPTVTSQLILDGTSQPNCTVPCIVLSGAVLGGTNDGLVIHADNSLIKGFIITSWGGSGIMINGTGNQIQSNDIGFWPGNPTPLHNVYGINIIGGANNLIGGTTGADRNIVSGNTWGITIGGTGTTVTSGNIVEGNFIGTNPAGTSARGNSLQGIYLGHYAAITTIGGTTAGARNVISGNHLSGIAVNGAADSKIWGNFIGTNAAGTGALGNRAGGILVNYDAKGNQIGGTGAGMGNRIEYNTGGGVVVMGAGTVRNPIRHNSIFSNTALGIDLGNDGVTPNDALDADTGPNMLQNYPVLTTATSSTRVITGTLNSVASHSFAIDVFASATCDASLHGEGKVFLGSVNVTTNAAGNGSFNFTVPVAFAVGNAITATATDSGGNTSEFSACQTAN